MQEILWVLGQHSDFLACISKSNRVKGPRVRVIMSSQAKLEIVRVFFLVNNLLHGARTQSMK